LLTLTAEGSFKIIDNLSQVRGLGARKSEASLRGGEEELK